MLEDKLDDDAAKKSGDAGNEGDQELDKLEDVPEQEDKDDLDG